MGRPPTASPAEARVLRWALAVFFVLACVLIVSTWWRKSNQCSASCIAQGAATGELKLTGGGRPGMSTVCLCRGAAAAAQPPSAPMGLPPREPAIR
jgi:hypothetical protein